MTNTGRGWAFPPYLDDRSRMAMAQGDTDVRQSIYIILNTIPGERVMRPQFGCSIHELIFWPANHQTAAIAERYVREALERWEPRINLRNVTVIPAEEEGGVLMIEIAYELKDQHDIRNLVYPYYLSPA